MRMLLLEPSEVRFHARARRLLHLRIERGVNLEPRQVAVETRNSLDLSEYVVGEIRRAAKPGQLGDLDWRGGSFRILSSFDNPVAAHQAQHRVAARAAGGGMTTGHV